MATEAVTTEQGADKDAHFKTLKDKLWTEYQPEIDSIVSERLVKELARRDVNGFATVKSEDPNKNFSDWLQQVTWVKIEKNFDVASKAFNRLKEVYDYDPQAAYKAAPTSPNMNQGTGSSGGFTVPIIYSSDIVNVEYPESVFFPSGAYIHKMASNSEKIPSFDYSGGGSSSNSGFSAGLQVSLVSEASLPAQTTQPAFTQISLTAEKLETFTAVSVELVQNNIVGIVSLLQQKIQDEITSQVDYNVMNGDGGQFTGILGHASTLELTRNTNNTIKLADVALMHARALPRRRKNYVWLVHPSAEDQLTQLADAAGRIIMHKDLTVTGDPVFELYGNRVITTDIVGTKGYHDLVFLDPTRYIVGVNRETRIDVSDHYLFGYGLVSYLASVWLCGRPGMSSKITLRDSTTTLAPAISLGNTLS